MPTAAVPRAAGVVVEAVGVLKFKVTPLATGLLVLSVLAKTVPPPAIPLVAEEPDTNSHESMVAVAPDATTKAESVELASIFAPTIFTDPA